MGYYDSGMHNARLLQALAYDRRKKELLEKKEKENGRKK